MKKYLLLLLILLSLGGSFKGWAVHETPYRTALVLAYSKVNSVYEDENLLLEIYDGQLWVTNKTKKTIFIDLAQSFLINNGATYPILESLATEKTGSRGKYTTSIDEYISISPSIGTMQKPTKICNLANALYRKYKTNESAYFSDYDKRLVAIVDELLQESAKAHPKGKEYWGTASRHLTEDESVSNIGASIAYAFNKKAEEWENVMISTWVSDVIIAPYYITLPERIDKKDKRGFNVKERRGENIHVKAESPFEFEADKSPILVVDWAGDIKNGNFTLSSLEIEDPDVEDGSGVKFYKTAVYFQGADSLWGKLRRAGKSFDSYKNNLIRNRRYIFQSDQMR